ncbi:MAG TPA: tetratricopeptide repeat protein [Nostocaceae cyanobacterium]|nr:tetratricopeptide repeat protein [Nostocaceae cyanobacterium]
MCCEEEGKHSELTIISGEKLNQLRNFCWEMAEKYKRNSPVRDIFINNMKGKLAEEVVKSRLDNLVTAVDYEIKIGGDGKIDFTLTSVPDIGIQVKSRHQHGDINKVKWPISKEEIEKNAVLVCVLIQEEINEAQTKYNLVLAGFIPTNMINLINGKVSVGIDELLYPGCLRGYLEYLTSSKTNEYTLIGNECFNREDYQGAISYYNKALEINPKLAIAYTYRGFAYYYIGQMENAIEDFTKAINTDINYVDAYYGRSIIYYSLRDYNNASKDFIQATKIDLNYVNSYCYRGIIYHILGDNDNAIKDYTEVIKFDLNFSMAYLNRGLAYYNLKDNYLV